MENAKTFANLLNAGPLSDDDLLAVFKPNIINILTQRPGDTRKVTVSDLVKYINEKQFSILNSHADEADEQGRNLLEVLGVSTIPAAMAALSVLCNGTGVPKFSQLMVGDYLDGLDLSAIPAENGGDAGQAWNDIYKSNRITISGFNTYKNFGDFPTVKNHILFSFRNCPMRKRMNPTEYNAGGYHETEMRAFLDGKNGDGTDNYTGGSSVTTGAFLKALRAQLGGDYVLKIRKMLDASTYGGTENWSWPWYSVFLMTENELFGDTAWGRQGFGDGCKVHVPLYQKSTLFRYKKYNGTRESYWLATPCLYDPGLFSYSNAFNYATRQYATNIFGCAPAFCVASNGENIL